MPLTSTNVPPSPYEVLQARNLNFETSSFANVSMDSSARPAGLNSSKVVAYSLDSSGNIIGLVGASGATIDNIFCPLRAANTAAQNAALLQASINYVQGTSSTGGGTIYLPRGTFSINQVTISDGYAMLGSGYRGGICILGQGQLATRLNVATGIGFLIEAVDSSWGGTMQSIELGQMAIYGPGSGTAGSRGISCSPQTNVTRIVNNSNFHDLFISDFEGCIDMDDFGDNSIRNCRFLNYVYGAMIGYNVDKLLIDSCTFGNNTITTSPDLRVAIGLYYNWHSPKHPSGTLSCSAHTIQNTMFLLQANAVQLTDIGAMNINFIGSYFEANTQIATFGIADGATAGPKNVMFLGCQFSRVYFSTETLAKFQYLSSAGNTTLSLINCGYDGTDGPNGGWIDTGSNATVIIDNCELPYAGSATAAYVIQRGTKKITLNNRADKYVFRAALGGAEIMQYNENASQSVPAKAVYGYQTDDNTIFQEYSSKNLSDNISAGNAAQVKNTTLNTVKTAHWNGFVKLLSTTTTKPAAAVALRGMFYLEEVANVDTLYICAQTGSGTYAWKAINWT